MSDGDVKGEQCHARVDVVSFFCTRGDISTNSCEDFGALKTAASIYPLRHTFVVRENMSRRVVVSGKTFEPVFFLLHCPTIFRRLKQGNWLMLLVERKRRKFLQPK